MKATITDSRTLVSTTTAVINEFLSNKFAFHSSSVSLSLTQLILEFYDETSFDCEEAVYLYRTACSRAVRYNIYRLYADLQIVNVNL